MGSLKLIRMDVGPDLTTLPGVGVAPTSLGVASAADAIAHAAKAAAVRLHMLLAMDESFRLFVGGLKLCQFEPREQQIRRAEDAGLVTAARKSNGPPCINAMSWVM